MSTKEHVIIPDVIPHGSSKKGDNIPPMPIPDISKGELVVPASLDRLPDDIKEKILNWHIENVPTRKMALLLRKDGISVSHLRLWRWAKAQFRGTNVTPDGQYSTNMDEVRIELEKKAVYGAIDLCIETLRKAKAPEISTATDLDKVSSALAKLVSAMAARERVEYEKGLAIQKVRDKLKSEFQRLMSTRPDLVNEVHALLEEASEKIAIDG